TGGTADRNRSHWSTSKTPSYTKSVSWQHHQESCRDCNSCIRPSFSLSRSAIIRLNVANARFVYQPFTRDQRARG
ncbi:hypothetical protein AB0Z39_11900, partial [Escherichia coli]